MSMKWTYEKDESPPTQLSSMWALVRTGATHLTNVGVDGDGRDPAAPFQQGTRRHKLVEPYEGILFYRTVEPRYYYEAIIVSHQRSEQGWDYALYERCTEYT